MSQRHEEEGLNELEQMDKNHVFGTWSYQKNIRPREVVDTSGVRFQLADGTEYLDFSSQLVCNNLGFDAENVRAAVTETMTDTPYLSPYTHTTEARAKLGKALADITPGSLSKSLFSTSGTEAVEAAIKIARAYTGKHKIVSRYREYHGATYGSISATGDPRRFASEPGVPGMIKAPDAYEYGSKIDPMESLEYIDEMLMLEGDTVAAILIEPIVGGNGVIVPPDDYLPRLQEIAHDHDALLICDEVLTGFGRTGEWFASDHYDITPDIITTAKGLSSAYVPMAAATVTGEIAEFFEDTQLSHGHTYAGHPVGCAAALAAIETYREDDLIERASEVGAYLGDKLTALADAHPSVGDVRGVGMLHGLELTKDPTERVPFGTRADMLSADSTVIDDVKAEAKSRGLYVLGVINTLIVAPPLTITKAEIDKGIDILDTALEVSDRAMHG